MLTVTATATNELFLFGGLVHGHPTNDLYLFSIQDFSTTLLQTSGEVPSPRYAHGATLIDTTLLICGGVGLNYDSLYLLDLGTLELFMSSPTSADHSFVLQYCENGPTLWSMVPNQAVVPIRPQPW